MTSTADPGPAPSTLGPCRLLRRLGSGGMGTVHLGEMAADRPYATTGSAVAVKILHGAQHDWPEAVRRFEREARLGRSISHPSVVRTHEAGMDTVDGVTYHYLVMELVEGRTLRDVMGELCPVPEPLLRDLSGQVARALAAIHAAGIVHRDIKPTNILITPEWIVKVMDLGTSRLADGADALTRSGFFVGTFLYAAPEQFRGSDVGPAADLYALGAVLYEAATGTKPFEGASVQEVVRKHLDVRPPRAGKLNAQVSPFFEEILACLLEKEPELRLPSAARLASVIEEGEASSWWRERERSLRARSPRGELRQIRVPRDTPLIGRESEMTLLRSLETDARAGRGRVLVIEGEAGVGKTRLLDTLVRELIEGGADVDVLHGSSPPGEMGGGRGAISQAIASHFGADLATGLRRHLASMPRLVPALEAYLTAQPAPADGEPLSQDALHAAICQLATSMARERPLLWIVDDLHFASAESRSLFASLAQSVPDQRILLVTTTRTSEIPEIAAVSRLEGARRMQLARLSARHVIDLLEAILHSDSMAEKLGGRLARRSDGNPFFVLETIRELAERGLATRQPDGSYRIAGDITTLDVPSSVRALIGQRLADLGDADAILLDVAAVHGFHFDPDLVARVLGRPRLDVLQSLGRLERRSGVVRATGAGFHFDHHQLQEILLERMPPLLRNEYCALLADALEARDGLAMVEESAVAGEAAVFLAEHFLRGGRLEGGRRYLVRALDHLVSRFETESLLELCALATPALAGDATLRCDVRLREAAGLAHVGRRDAEQAAGKAAVDAALDAGDEVRRARALAALGACILNSSRPLEARKILDEACDVAERTGATDALAAALLSLAAVHGHLGEYEAARRTGERHQALARSLGDERQEGHALGQIVAALERLGRHDEARRHCEEGLAIARRTGDVPLELRLVTRLASNYMEANRDDEARPLLDRSVALARETGNRPAEAQAHGSLAHLETRLCRHDAARVHYARAIELYAQTGGVASEALARSNVGVVALREGRIDEAIELMEKALELARKVPGRFAETHVLRSLGTAMLARGDMARAREVHERAVAQAHELRDPGAISTTSFSLGRTLVACGELDAARPLLLAASDLSQVDSSGPRGICAAYLALLGEIPWEGIRAADGESLDRQAEMHLVLHRAGAPREHVARARELLEELGAQLTGPALETFWRDNPQARMLARVE